MTPEQVHLRIADQDEIWNIRMDCESDDCRKLPQTPSWVERVGEVIDDLMHSFLGKEMPRE